MSNKKAVVPIWGQPLFFVSARIERLLALNVCMQLNVRLRGGR
jgi:hypothetical protein